LRDVETIFKGKKVVGFKGNKKTLVEIENHRELCKNIFELCKKYDSKVSIDLVKKFIMH